MMALKLSSKSLGDEISSLERQIRLRRSAIKTDSATLLKMLKSRIGTPKVMLGACGVGFLLGEFTRRPRVSVKKPVPSQASVVNTHKAKESTPFRDLSHFVAVTYSLFNSWPVAFLRKNLTDYGSNNNQQAEASPRHFGNAA